MWKSSKHIAQISAICTFLKHLPKHYKETASVIDQTKRDFCQYLHQTKWKEQMASQSQDSLRLSPKWYAKIVEVQIVQQQRSTLKQLKRASSSVTFRDQRWAYHLLPSHVLYRNWTTAHPSIFHSLLFQR